MNGELGKSISLIPIENDDNFYNIYHDNTPSVRKINSLLKRSYDFNKITNIFPEQNKIEDNSTKYRKLQLPKLNLKLNRNYKLPSLRIPHSGIFKEKLIKRENINTKKKSLTINNIVFDENQSFKYNSIDRIQSMKKFIQLNKKNIINRNIIKNKYEKDLMEFKIYSHNMNEMIADQIVIEFFKRINKTQNLNFNDLLLNYIKSCDGENNIPEETLVINNDFNISKDENKEKDEKIGHNLIIHNVFFEWIINKVIQNYTNYIKKTKMKISAKSIKNIIINEVKNLSKLFFHKKYEKIKMILNTDNMNSKIDDNNQFQEEEYSENNIEIKKRKIKRELIDNIIEKTLKKNRNSIKQSDILNNNLKSFTNKNKRNSDVKINLKRNSNFNNDMKIIVDDIPNLIIRNENNSELDEYQKNNNNLTLENLNIPIKNKKKSIQLISVETNTDSTLIEKYKPLMDIKEENNDLQNQLYQPYYIYEGIDIQSEEKEKIISKNRKSIISSKFSERNKNQKNSNDLESLMYEIKTKNNMEYNKNYNSDNKINKNNDSKNENKDNYEKIEENNLDSDIKENTTKIMNNDLESNIKDNNKKYEKNNIESYNKENITKNEKSDNNSNFNEYKKINKNLRQRNKNKSINNKSGERENSNQIKIEKENIKDNKKTIRNKIIIKKVKNLKDNSKSKYKRKDIQRKSNTKINNNNDKQEVSRKNLEDEYDERENEIEELNNEEEEDEEKEEENEEEENEEEENEEEEEEEEEENEEINKQKILPKKKKKSKKISMIKKNMENEIEKEKEKSYTGNKTDIKRKKKKTNKKENKIVPKKSIANQNIKINSEFQGDEKEIETKIENKDIEDNQNENDENINKDNSIEGFDNSQIENDINTENKSEELNKKENLIVKDEKNHEIDIIKEEKYNLGKEDIEEIKEVAEPEIKKKKKRRKKKIKKETSNQKNLNNQNTDNKNIIKEKEINNDKLIGEKEKEEIEEEEESEYYEDEEESEKVDYYEKDISLNKIKKVESLEDKILKEQEEKKEKEIKEKNYIRNNKTKKKTRLSQRKSTVVKLFKKKSIFDNSLNNTDRRSSRKSFTTKDIQHILQAITIPSQILEKEKIQENDYELNKSEERRNRGRKRIKHRKTQKKIKLLKLTDTSQSAFERFKKEQEMKKQLKLEEERKEREKLKKYFVDLKALKQLNDEGFDNYIRGKFDTLKYIKDSNDTKLRKEHFIFNIMKDFELLKKRKQKFNFVSPIKFFNQ